MNCNGRGMATLLQQKNYMKSLSNGGVGGGGNNNPNNGTTSAVTTTTLQQTRMLLPHEIASAPSIQHSHTIIPASGVVTQTGTGFIMTGVSAGQTIRLNQQSQLPQYAIQTTSNHNQFQTPISLQQYTTHNNTFFPQLSHNGPNTIFLPVSIASNNNVKFSNVHTPINTVVPSSFRGILNTATQNHVYQQSYPAMTSVITNRLPTIINSIPGPSTQYPKIIRQEKTIEKPIAPKKVIEWVIQKPAVQKPVIIQKPIEKSVEPPNKPEQHQIDNTKQIKQQPINNPVEDKKCDINKTDSSTAQKIDAKKDENAIIEDLEEAEAEPEVDIVINNVVCSFSVRCHLNLRDIALNGFNVEFRRQNAMVTMKLRRPYTTASIWSSGRITCTGATSEDQAKIAARRYARCLQKLGFRVRFQNFRIVNVLGTCSMPWAIKIVNFSEKYKKDASYEPELHPGVTYKIKNPRATMKIFSTGSITVTANSVANVQAAIEHIYPLVYEFRKKRTNYELELLRSKPSNEEVDLGLKMDEDDDDFFEQDFPHPNAIKKKRPLGRAENDPTEDIMNVSGNDEFDDGDDIDDINI